MRSRIESLSSQRNPPEEASDEIEQARKELADLEAEMEYLQNKMPLTKEREEWLGHAESRMVEHYRHRRNEDAQRKTEQIDLTGLEDSGPPGMVLPGLVSALDPGVYNAPGSR